MNKTSFALRSLAWMNLRRRIFRSVCLTGIVALFSFILFGGALLNENLSQGLESLSNRLGADILLVPYGYGKDTQAALLRGEPSTFYMKAELFEKIRHDPKIAQASPQFFLASLDAGCCSVKVQIIGYDPATDFLVHPWTREKHSDLKKGQVIVGSRITTAIGGEIVLFGVSYTVAAKMEPTGMGFDTSIFMNLNDVYDLMHQGGLAQGDLESAKQFVSSIAIKTKPEFPPRDVANDLMNRYAIDYELDFVLTKNLISDISTRLKNASSFVWILAGVIWFMALIIMSIVFSSVLNERKRELSLFRILGATRSWLSRMILFEACYIGFGGALLGIIAVSLIFFPFSALIFQSIGLPHLPISLPRIIAYALAVFALAGSAGPLSSLYSVLSITRFDIYQTLREGE